MLGEIDPFDFTLAEALGLTLAQVHAMPNDEYVQWRAFHRYRNEMSKLHG